MPIEFPCSQCGKLLRTGDDTAGREARCPACQAITVVPQPGGGGAPPAEGAPPSQGAPPPPSYIPTPATNFNAYQAPMTDAAAVPADSRLEVVPGQLDLGAVLNAAWSVFKARWTDVILGALVVIGMSIGFSVVRAVVEAATSRNQALHATVLTAFVVVDLLFQSWIAVGNIRYMLQIARGEPARLEVLFSGLDVLLPFLGGMILFGLAFFVGFVLLIVPGIIIAMMFSQALYLIADRRLPVFAAFSTSRAVMVGNKLTLFATGLVAIGLSILGVLACCVGIIPVYFYTLILAPIVYLTVTGEQPGLYRLPPGYDPTFGGGPPPAGMPGFPAQ